MSLDPFVIRLVMDSPVILSDGASLDAAMAYQGFEDGGDGLELLDRLFARVGRIHSASWLLCEKEHLTDRVEFVRLQRVGAALNIDNLKPSRGMTAGFRVDNKRGIAANKLTTYKTIITPSVWAFATGDIAATVDALSNVTSIGLSH